jgi:hypothetical protein
MLRVNRTGHEQHVRMARRSDKVNTEALDVMDGVIERIDFQLTSVAGAGIDLSDGEGAAEDIVDLGSEAVANPLLTGAARHRIAGKHMVTAVPGGHFKFLRDSHSSIRFPFAQVTERKDRDCGGQDPERQAQQRRHGIQPDAPGEQIDAGRQAPLRGGPLG